MKIIKLAREACDQLGIAYSNGACDPFKPTAKAANKFAGIGQEKVPPTGAAGYATNAGRLPR